MCVLVSQTVRSKTSGHYMHGATVQYEFSGDEAKWDAVIAAFVQAIDSDPDVSGLFTYRVTRTLDGNKRIHWAQWDVPETAQLLQTRDYFKSFSVKLQELLEGKLEPAVVSILHKTKD
ncbi:hypothetical protein GV827_21375 [Sulfitobacter sp. JBTF-M27]|uniref:ABM domain-containing protein n=1 Tax=Sulfitobacter sediminilitoris TaxID=2698830 RepID=A0A6P0CIW9_9RHOB|nr:hypothetical protein [Sulfitobacter sediminilitoris]NEK24925.1 hypothetical protein [Sulfitobacter sediminilitoris]